MKPLALPWQAWPVALLCAIYLLAGIFGHDPWKTEDALHLGVAYEFAAHGNWLTPRIAGDPWFGSPPLYHWVAALTGMALEGWLPFHEGARLASALFGAILLLSLAAAARELGGTPAQSSSVPLLAVGTLGLLLPIHDAEPLIALLAAQATLIYGLAKARQRPFAGGIIAGIAFGSGILASGATALLFLTPLALVPLLHPSWRTRKSFLGILLALLFGLAIAGIWPLLLYLRAPDNLAPWLNAESAKLTVHPMSWKLAQDHLELLGWAAWPILPLALGAVWGQQKQLMAAPVLVPLLGSGFTLLMILVFCDPHPLSYLLLIVPMTLLAASGVDKLRRGAANLFDWFGMMTFSLLAGLIWLGGISMATGEPARIAKNFLKAEPGYMGELSLPATGLALGLSLLWLWLVLRLPRSPWRGICNWAGGLALGWSLLVILWMPWIDYGRSYRPVAAMLTKALGDSKGCIFQLGLGDAQKASLRYFSGIAPQAYVSRGCPWLLMQTASRSDTAPAGWRRVWEGSRPGDKGEKLRLYRRD